MQLLARYLRFVIVAAILAASSLVVLEILHRLIGYRSGVAEAFWSWLIYLVGLAINFQLQKRWVFATSHDPSFGLYASWMIASAFIVGALSGVIFTFLQRHFPALPFTAGISLVLALGLNSPITFIGVSLIMRARRHKQPP